MTSGNFAIALIDSITIDRSVRQRRELTGIDELAASIAATGLINPPVITREGILVAGERRLTACRQLGWSSIPVQYAEDLDPLALHMIELEENVKREELPWQDHAAAVAEYHRLRGDIDPSWNQQQTAKALGITPAYASQLLAVSKAVEAKDALVLAAPKISTAIGIVQRKAERQRTAVLRDLAGPEPEAADTPEGSAPVPSALASILTGSFENWAADYTGPKFSFIHCDFPYGVVATKSGQSSAKELGGYDDEEGTYFNLLSAFATLTPFLAADSAHLMFWFSMDFYSETKAVLEGAGWFVSPFPLIWGKSDNKGMMPDFNRQPRRIYETAFFCTFGDPRIVRPVANAVWSPVTKETHMSEKPLAVLEHFFRMIVDETTTFLDPTCGGGNAVRQAARLGASRALGIEINPEYADRARANLAEGD